MTNDTMTNDTKATRRSSPAEVPHGFISNLVEDLIRNKLGPGRHFTQLELWNLVPEQARATLLAGYKSTADAKKAVFRSTSNVRSNLAGLTLVEKRAHGRSVWVWKPPSSQDKAEANGVGEKTTFTVVGYTSDAKPLYRNEATGELGWFSWESL